MGISKTSDHIQIKIKVLNPSQEPPIVVWDKSIFGILGLVGLKLSSGNEIDSSTTNILFKSLKINLRIEYFVDFD